MPEEFQPPPDPDEIPTAPLGGDENTAAGPPNPGAWSAEPRANDAGPDSGHIRKANDTFADYVLVSPLGKRGGQGEVWQARHRATSEMVALKIYASHRETRIWQNREKQAIGQTKPGRPRLKAVSTTSDGIGWLAMDLVKGQAITDAARGRSLSDRLGLIARSGEHLSAAHKDELLHRDISGGNILVSSTGPGSPGVCIIDWGLSSNIDDRNHTGDDRTIAGEFAGTPEYTAPEVLHDGLNASTVRSEILMLGVVLHELVTGLKLYEAVHDGRDRVAAAKAFWERERHPDPLARLAEARRNGLDPTAAATPHERQRWEDLLRGPLGRVLLCATHENASNRYAGCDEFIHDLEAIRTAIGTSAAPDPLVCDRCLPRGGNPWLRRAYVDRIANDAALYAGAHALIRTYDLPRARRLLSLVSISSRSGWEYGYLSALAEPALFVIEGDTP